MRIIVHTIFATFLCLSMPVLASAPVVDDSENFVLLEEQAQAAEELPVAQDDAYPITNDLKEATRNHATNPSSHTAAATARNIDFVNTLQSLQKEVQELRGQLEMQAHELDELKQQQLAYYQDLDARLDHNQSNTEHNNQAIAPKQTAQPDTANNLSANNTSAAPHPEMEIQPMRDLAQATPNKIRLNPADEQISYLAAYDLVKQKNFSQATEAMRQFLTKYPQGGYSANAHYWLGELHLANKDYSEAISQFDTIIKNFKSSSKYAPSRLKLGCALAESGRIGEAKEQLTTVMNLYPDTSTAHLAQSKLEKLGE